MSIIFPKKKEDYRIYGLAGGIVEAIYCFFIATLVMSLNNVLAGPTVFNFLLMLLIIVFSVAVSGILIFGYPLYLALKKQYQEAIFTVLISLVTLIILGLLIIIFKVIF